MSFPPRNRRARRRSEPIGAFEAVTSALEKSGFTDAARKMRIQFAWEAAVGPRIAAHTQPESFRRGVLLVKANSAAWQNELTFLRADLIQKLNAALGKNTVRDIKVVAGSLRKPPPKPKAPIKPPSEKACRSAHSVGKTIDDPDLRRAFESAMARVVQDQNDGTAPGGDNSA